MLYAYLLADACIHFLCEINECYVNSGRVKTLTFYHLSLKHIFQKYEGHVCNEDIDEDYASPPFSKD